MAQGGLELECPDPDSAVFIYTTLLSQLSPLSLTSLLTQPHLQLNCRMSCFPAQLKGLRGQGWFSTEPSTQGNKHSKRCMKNKEHGPCDRGGGVPKSQSTRGSGVAGTDMLTPAPGPQTLPTYRSQSLFATRISYL